MILIKKLQSYVYFHFGPLSNLACKCTFSTALFSMKNLNPRDMVVLYLLASTILSQHGSTFTTTTNMENQKRGTLLFK